MARGKVVGVNISTPQRRAQLKALQANVNRAKRRRALRRGALKAGAWVLVFTAGVWFGVYLCRCDFFS